MDDKLHITSTPTAVSVGETLTITIDCEGKFKNAEEVIIKVTEQGSKTPMVVFTGKLADNTFTKTSDPIIHSVPGGTDKVKIGLSPSTEPDVEVPLKGKGIFKVQVTIEAKKPKPGSFTSPQVVLFRAFVRGTRPIIAFISGSESDAFFGHAAKFWEFPSNADKVVKQKGISIQEILQQLETLGATFGPWGQVNIVAHGFPDQIQIKILPDSILPLHEDKIAEELQRLSDKGGTLPAPNEVDSDTEIIFRSCNAGQSQSLVDEVKSQLFGGAKNVKIPKFLQFYATGAGVAIEFFQEELLYDLKTKPATDADVTTADDANLPAKFDVLKTTSPGLGAAAVASTEIPTFKERKFTEALFTLTSNLPELDTVDASGTPLTTAQLETRYRGDWVPKFENEKKSATSKTTADRWSIQVTKKETAKEGLFFQSAQTTPKFHHNSAGVVLGSNVNGGGAMTINGPNIDGFHAVIEPAQKANGDPDLTRVVIEFKPVVPAADIVVGKVVLNASNTKGTFSLPITVQIDNISLAVRQGKRFDIEFKATRALRHVRRDMKKFDAAKAYADRPDLVVPNANDPLHFATSQ